MKGYKEHLFNLTIGNYNYLMLKVLLFLGLINTRTVMTKSMVYDSIRQSKAGVVLHLASAVTYIILSWEWCWIWNKVVTIPQFKKKRGGGGEKSIDISKFVHDICLGENDIIIMGSGGQDETDTIVTGWSDLVSVFYCLCVWI